MEKVLESQAKTIADLSATNTAKDAKIKELENELSQARKDPKPVDVSSAETAKEKTNGKKITMVRELQRTPMQIITAQKAKKETIEVDVADINKINELKQKGYKEISK